MKIIAYEMDLASRDIYLQHIEQLIYNKKQMLMKKQKYLGKVEKQNEFLKEVRNDYIHYHTYIVEQKQDQVRALESLNSYIDKLTKSGQLSSNNIKDAQEEQYKIMREINMIKKNVDQIIRQVGENKESQNNL